MAESTRWTVDFFKDARGEYPVKMWVLVLPLKDQARITRPVELLETYGTLLRMPHCRHIRGKIWELRIAVGRRDYRVLYFTVTGRRFILLHGFDKTTAKTPERELEIAEGQMREHQTQEGS